MTLEIVTYFLFFVAFGTTKAANENSVKIDLPQWAIPHHMNAEFAMDECGFYQNWKAYKRGNSVRCKGDGYQCEDLTLVCNDNWTNRACRPLQNDPGAEIYGWIQEDYWKTSCPKVMMSHIQDEVSGPMQIFASYVNHANSTEHAALRVKAVGEPFVNFTLVETLEHCGDWSDYVMMHMKSSYCNIYTYDPSQRRKFKRNSHKCDFAVQIFRSGAWQPIIQEEGVDNVYVGIRVTDSSSVSCPKIVIQLDKKWNPNTEDPGWTKFLVETNPHRPKVEEQPEEAEPKAGWSSLNPSIHFMRNDQGHLKDVKIAFDMTSNVTDIDAGRLGFLEDILKTITEPIEVKPFAPPQPPPPPPPTTTRPAGSPGPSYPSYTTAPYY